MKERKVSMHWLNDLPRVTMQKGHQNIWSTLYQQGSLFYRILPHSFSASVETYLSKWEGHMGVLMVVRLPSVASPQSLKSTFLGCLGVTVSWASNSWFPLMSWSQGCESELHVRLHNKRGVCLSFFLSFSFCPSGSCCLSLSLSQRNLKKPLKK